jgi:hypothetical protein
MTTLVSTIRTTVPTLGAGLPRINRRVLAIALLVAAVALVPGGWSLAGTALADAYLAVGVFVAGTLALLAWLERGLRIDLGEWLARRRRWQVPAAALLGAFPGCGGAIAAVTQYSRGHLSFGAVVATLTATMGDAMFLLLIAEPATALGLLVIGVVVGIVTGLLVDRIHGEDFLRPPADPARASGLRSEGSTVAPNGIGDRAWVMLAVPGSVAGLLAAVQLDVGDWLVAATGIDPAHWIGVAGGLLALAMWSVVGESRGDCMCSEGRCDIAPPTPLQRVVDTTNFVTSWVVFAFVGYELLVAVTGVDLGGAFAVWGPLVPAIAVLVGLIPGCGPQILVTSLYLSGGVPLSAQLGNAIANDGDALLPVLAVAPKAALFATLYSAVPALLVAYGWYAWVEVGATIATQGIH